MVLFEMKNMYITFFRKSVCGCDSFLSSLKNSTGFERIRHNNKSHEFFMRIGNNRIDLRMQTFFCLIELVWIEFGE